MGEAARLMRGQRERVSERDGERDEGDGGEEKLGRGGW